MVEVMLGAIFRGAIHPEMGRRDGVLCAHLDFPNHLSDEPGLLKYSQIFGTSLGQYLCAPQVAGAVAALCWTKGAAVQM